MLYRSSASTSVALHRTRRVAAYPQYPKIDRCTGGLAQCGKNRLLFLHSHPSVRCNHHCVTVSSHATQKSIVVQLHWSSGHYVCRQYPEIDCCSCVEHRVYPQYPKIDCCTDGLALSGHCVCRIPCVPTLPENRLL
jgi:hypothetical protein